MKRYLQVCSRCWSWMREHPETPHLHWKCSCGFTRAKPPNPNKHTA